jgi:hypothetical protein
MPIIRFSRALTSFTRSAAPASVRQPASIRTLSTTPFRAAQGYGDGKGDPKAENPQDQGASNTTKQNAEHPGPAPPAEGQGTGAGPTKAGTKSPEEASANSGGSRSKEAKETGSSPTGGAVGGSEGKSSNPGDRSVDGASPKIHNQEKPAANDSNKQAEVEKHNREFEKGHDRGSSTGDDKVDKKFWSGELLFPVYFLR